MGYRDDFPAIVIDVWQVPIDGNLMVKFIKLLGMLKPKLKSLHRHNTNHIFSHVIKEKG